ncbi:MAG: large conductance mechanosensitive channel protein MscL, partial [Duncaniella sp.]|nr:large conductance mechanosensitive channel protein MscL [Duncaniella sp.]
KAINNLKREEPAAEEAPTPAEPTKEEVLLTEIRDLLKQQSK